MLSGILNVRLRPLIAVWLLAVLLFSALWFGALDKQTSEAQDATATLLPDQLTAVAQTLEASREAAHVYDTFSAPALDTQKWDAASDFECQIQPENGALTIANARSTQELFCDLEVKLPRVDLSDLGLVQAQIMIKDDHNHLELNEGIELSTTSLSSPIYLFCGVNAEVSGISAVATGNILVDGTMKEFYKTSDSVPVAYNEFHTFRWVIDAANLTATCSADNGEIIDVIPLNKTAGIERASWLISLSSYRSEGAVATSSIDNVILIP